MKIKEVLIRNRNLHGRHTTQTKNNPQLFKEFAYVFRFVIDIFF